MGQQELENEDMKKLFSTLMEGLEIQSDSDFFQDDNDVQKKKAKVTTKYCNTKVKLRNLLTFLIEDTSQKMHKKQTLLSMFFRF